jgi:hypothetical protein
MTRAGRVGVGLVGLLLLGAALPLMGQDEPEEHDAGVMSPEACIAASESFIELMKTDPAWKRLVNKPGQVDLMRSQAETRCAKPIEPADRYALQCMARVSDMSELQRCMMPMLDEAAAASSRGQADDSPELTQSKARCLKIQAHIHQVMVDDPGLSADERLKLISARERHGTQSDERACQPPFTPEGEVLLACLEAVEKMDGLTACVSEAKTAQEAKMAILLKAAQANTERLRATVKAQQDAGKALVSFTPTPTPAQLQDRAVDLNTLPPSPGTEALSRAKINTPSCAYRMSTHQEDGGQLPGGFNLRTRCDLDNDGVPVVFSASASEPAHRITAPGHF